MVLDRRAAEHMAEMAKTGCTLQEYAEKTIHTRMQVLEGKKRVEIPLDFSESRKRKGEIILLERELEAAQRWGMKKEAQKRSRKRFWQDAAGAMAAMGAAAMSAVIMAATQNGGIRLLAFLCGLCSAVAAYGYSKRMDEEMRRECWK